MVEVIDANGCVSYCEASVSCKGTGSLTNPEEGKALLRDEFGGMEINELLIKAYPG